MCSGPVPTSLAPMEVTSCSQPPPTDEGLALLRGAMAGCLSPELLRGKSRAKVDPSISVADLQEVLE
eukprot:2275032-Alexandrium_andersonii.AAC.1